MNNLNAHEKLKSIVNKLANKPVKLNSSIYQEFTDSESDGYTDDEDNKLPTLPYLDEISTYKLTFFEDAVMVENMS